MSPEDLEILKNYMNGATPPPFAVKMLEDVCKRTGLDWKTRHVYLEKRKNKNGTEVWRVPMTIDGFRMAGSRHPHFAGQEGPFWTLSPPPEYVWFDNPPEGAPYASKCGIKKKLDNGVITITWGTAKYKDYYAGMMWDKFPSTMIAKCAEMLAWRKTFPDIFGGVYGKEELEQEAKNPKETLKESEVLAEVPTDEQLRDQAETGQPTAEELRLEYRNRLEMAKSGDEVTAIGREIQKDKRLEQMQVLELHQLYTKMKAKHA